MANSMALAKMDPSPNPTLSQAHPETMDFLSHPWCNFAVQALQPEAEARERSLVLHDTSIKIFESDAKSPSIQAYGCSKKCGYTRLLHEECAALPRRITHAVHPQHVLIQQRFQHLSRCTICKRYIWSIGYGCRRGECEFQMHIRCAQGSGMMEAYFDDDDDEEERRCTMRHPSHPQHELRLHGVPIPSRCGACGMKPSGRSYMCNACLYWIHHGCATLPHIINREDHHHSLSLSYHVPPQYIKFDFKCGVCKKYLLGNYWIYHCEHCRYVVHVKCTFQDLYRPNVVDHWSHEHPLTLMGAYTGSQCLVCERSFVKTGEKGYGCIKCWNPYPQPHLLHEECAEMPRKIRHPMHPQHQLIQQHIQRLPCIFCPWQIGRIGYRCAECKIQAHIECVQDSNMIVDDEQGPLMHHRGHSRHELRLWRSSFVCGACGDPPRGRSYICTGCEYWVHERWASVPPQVLNRFDHHHMLSLSFFIPLEYYKNFHKCEICYRTLGQRYWIYHCELCKYVVHLKCAFKKMPHDTTRNIGEVEVEEETVAHRSHEHPLILAETRKEAECYGCEGHVTSGELAYVCSKKCGYQGLLHEECGEMAIKIRHPLHPQHILTNRRNLSNCSVCKKQGSGIGYLCTSSECEFQIHMRCALDSVDELGGATLHPSHPQHELTLLKRSCLFRCDACGTKQIGKSYVCIACQYWIHQRCASLSKTFKREDHDHALSLSFCVPLEYIEYDFKCEVCRKDLLGRFWIYHCRLCRYAVHIGCIFKKPTPRIFEDDEKGVIRFPVYDVAQEQIQPFVMMKGEAMAPIPDDAVNAYEFYKEKHQMRLVSSSRGSRNEEENSDDEDDYGQISRLMCDGCATPIFQKQSSSSPSSSSKYYYMSCSEGKYFFHVPCFLMPPRLSSIPLHNKPDHELVLQTCPKLEFEKDCSFCKLPMNGLFYACKNKKCDFKADIKCATVPETIRHAAHPHHLLKLLTGKDIQSPRSCAAACNASRLCSDDYWYVCGSCKDDEEISIHVSCATLPKSTKNLKWDKKHALQLTFDANLNHPEEFYCDECEEQMNPKRWMYHCRDCDLSIHPDCFKTTSGECRNIKFGYRVSAAAHRKHHLTYQLLTAKRHCDVCGEDRYERRGFHCALCNFFIYFSSDCGAKMIGDGRIKAVD